MGKINRVWNFLRLLGQPLVNKDIIPAVFSQIGYVPNKLKRRIVSTASLSLSYEAPESSEQISLEVQAKVDSGGIICNYFQLFRHSRSAAYWLCS